MITALLMFASLVVAYLATVAFLARRRRRAADRRTLDAFVKSIADDLRAMPPDTHVAATGGGLSTASPVGDRQIRIGGRRIAMPAGRSLRDAAEILEGITRVNSGSETTADPSPEPSCCGACSGCQSCSCPPGRRL